MGRLNEDRVESIVQLILDDYTDERAVNKTDLYNQPDKKAVIDIVEKLLKILYPGYYGDKVYKIYSLRNNMSATIEDVIFHLKKQAMIVLKYCGTYPECIDNELEEKAQNMVLILWRRYRGLEHIWIQIFRQHMRVIRQQEVRMRSSCLIRGCMRFLFTGLPMSCSCLGCQ